MEGISLGQFEAEAASLRAELEEKRVRHAELASDIQRLERELALLAELTALRGGHGGVGRQLKPTQPQEASNGRDISLGDAVVTVLKGRGQQMHIQDLLTRVREMDIPIPGQGNTANLIAHIRTHPEIVRPVRGMYGLKEWGIVDAGPSVRAKRRRRRKR